MIETPGGTPPICFAPMATMNRKAKRKNPAPAAEPLLDRLRPKDVSLTALFAAARIDAERDAQKTLKTLESCIRVYCLHHETDAQQAGYDAAVRDFAKSWSS